MIGFALKVLAALATTLLIVGSANPIPKSNGSALANSASAESGDIFESLHLDWQGSTCANGTTYNFSGNYYEVYDKITSTPDYDPEWFTSKDPGEELEEEYFPGWASGNFSNVSADLEKRQWRFENNGHFVFDCAVGNDPSRGRSAADWRASASILRDLARIGSSNCNVSNPPRCRTLVCNNDTTFKMCNFREPRLNVSCRQLAAGATGLAALFGYNDNRPTSVCQTDNGSNNRDPRYYYGRVWWNLDGPWWYLDAQMGTPCTNSRPRGPRPV